MPMVRPGRSTSLTYQYRIQDLYPKYANVRVQVLKCGLRFDVFQSMQDAPLKKCKGAAAR